MDILKVISRLMAYPTTELIAHRVELVDVVEKASELPSDMRQALIAMMDEMAGRELMDLQEEYGSLFDRGRSLSLLLFEHVHGESRSRGQAMVDLMDVYQKSGFEISVRELPDYIPLYLEFLALQPEQEAQDGLADVSHILGMLSARLQERQSPYHLLFDALLVLSCQEVDLAELRKTAAVEERDDTMEAFDKVWEEEAVTFTSGSALDNAGAGCKPYTRPVSPGKDQAVPMQWVDRDNNPVSH